MTDVVILGTRGIPNKYGGFERLVEVLAPYLAERGHAVTVICEGESEESLESTDMWRGVRRLFIPTGSGAFSTLSYDLRSFARVREGSVALICGYGTAVFQLFLWKRGVPHCVNMDGIEWRRAKWGGIAKLWLRLNEIIATKLSDELVADHPEIQRYLSESLRARSTMIPYGAGVNEAINPGERTDAILSRSQKEAYFLLVARPEPENQVHVILGAYKASRRRAPFWVIGDFSRTQYGRALMVQHPEVEFLGPIYSGGVLNDLRRNCLLYFHGHSVGGTNPSLIEAMAAGSLICAHDNVYNRWVLDAGGVYFKTADDAKRHMDDESLQGQRDLFVARALDACAQKFRWEDVLAAYEQVVLRLDALRR